MTDTPVPDPTTPRPAGPDSDPSRCNALVENGFGDKHQCRNRPAFTDRFCEEHGGEPQVDDPLLNTLDDVELRNNLLSTTERPHGYPRSAFLDALLRRVRLAPSSPGAPEGDAPVTDPRDMDAAPPAGTGGERDVRYTVTPIVGSELTRWAVCDQHEVRFVGQCNSESQAKALADMLNATPASRSGGVTEEMVERGAVAMFVEGGGGSFAGLLQDEQDRIRDYARRVLTAALGGSNA